jgi:integrase
MWVCDEMLTDLKARKVKPGDKPLPDETVTGLRLIPSKKSGQGKWQLRFVSPVTAKRRDMGLGTFPEIQIATVRKEALAARQLLSQGVDPVEDKRARQSAITNKETVVTFKVAALIVHAELRPSWKNAKHADQWLNTLKTYVFPIVGDIPVSQLKPKDFANVLRPIWLQKAETASRVKQRCHGVMKWCWGRELVVSNPVDMVSTLLPKQPSISIRVSHQPSMPWRYVPSFVCKVVRASDNVTRHLLEFVILTAARSGEARAMTWSEVDLAARIWTIPANRMKSGIVHRVPVSDGALDLLKKRQALNLKSDLVFPSPRGLVLTDMALSSFLRKHHAPSDTVGRIATAHGFRSSFRDWASENSYSRDLAERALAHTIKNATEAAYHRTDLLDKRRGMMEAWANHVTGSAAAVAASVVPLVGKG